MSDRRLLVVDDQQEMREMARVALGLVSGWQVLTASSGREALSMAASQQPDAILLDVMMPDLDGPETFRQLQQQAATRLIPVVLLTADSHPQVDPGVAGTISKPFHPLKLASQVAAVLGWTL